MTQGIFITEEAMQAAADYLLENAELAAAAKAELILAKEAKQTAYDKVFMHAEGSIKYREAYAQCSPEHQEAIKRYAEAERTVEYHRRRHASVVAVTEAWRSQTAYLRDLGRLR
jgi:hypothetical protein